MAIAVIVVIILATVGAYYFTVPTGGEGTTSTSSTPAGSAFRERVVIDDVLWPSYGDLNQLYGVIAGPWPVWGEYSVYQTLVTANQTALFQDGTLEFLPALAADWTVSPDAKTYTFNLRNDVTFSNGHAFNAYQVWMEMYGFYYLSANSTYWMNGMNLFDMSSVEFGPATISLISQSGLINPSQAALDIMMDSSWPIYVTSPQQIVFRLRSPVLYFLGGLLAFEGLLFDTQYVLDNGGFGTPVSFNTNFNLHPIPGSGPYVVTDVSQNSYVQFTQDTNYWGKKLSQAELAKQPLFDPGHARVATIYYKPDDLARYTDLETGGAQIVGIGGANWNLITANPDKYDYLTIPPRTSLTSEISINNVIYPTNITDVRRAIVHAINYADIREKVFHGKSAPYVGPTDPEFKEFYNLGNMPEYTYDVELAKEYLAKANIANMPTLSFRVLSGCAFCVRIAEIVQSNLAEIGIPMDILVLQASTYWSAYQSYEYNYAHGADMGHFTLVGGTTEAAIALTPAWYWSVLVNEHALYSNYAVYHNPVVQKCVDAFFEDIPLSELQSICTVAQKAIYDDAPYAWIGTLQLWYGDGSLVWRKGDVTGFQVDPLYCSQNTAPIINTITFASSTPPP
jgi:peptide/nickel transport system substrate-binding protein